MKNNTPLISFCIATYKRESFLPRTIQSILNQSYDNIEIIVSDNDPFRSAEKIVKKFRNKKIVYHGNKKNIGMVKNFNKALSLSSGEFVVFMSDDDPVEKNFLSTLIPLYRKNPDYDGFFGASNIYIPDKQIADMYGFPVGKTSLTSKLQKKNEVVRYSKDNFLSQFFQYKVSSYILWSGGFAKKSLIKEIGGMPDYDSRLLTDFAYIAALGANGKMLYINKSLGYQTFHNDNSGRDLLGLKTLPQAALGFHKLVHPYVKQEEEILYQKYLINWIIDHLTGVKQFYNAKTVSFPVEPLLEIYKEIAILLPFFEKRYFELYLKLHYPKLAINTFKIKNRIQNKLKL